MMTTNSNLKRFLKISLLVLLGFVLICAINVGKSEVYADYIDSIDEQCADYTVLTKEMVNRDGNDYVLAGGEYRLESDFVFGASIVINQGDVTIYLNGHTLQASFICKDDFTLLDNSNKEGRYHEITGHSAGIIGEGATLSFSNVVFKDGMATAIDAYDSEVFIDDCVFENISAHYAFTGVIGSVRSTIIINNSILKNNVRDEVITYVIAMEESSRVELYNTQIINNNRRDTSYFGTIGIMAKDGENQYLKLSGSTTIRGNDTGIVLGKGCNVELLDNVDISGNVKYDLYIQGIEDESSKIILSPEAKSHMNVNIALEEAKDYPQEGYLVYLASDEFTNEFVNDHIHRTDGGNIAVIEGEEGHLYIGANYIPQGNVIRSSCSLCGKEGSWVLNMSDFDSPEDQGYYAEGDLSFRINLKKNTSKDKHFLSYPVVLYGYINPENGKVAEYSEDAPSVPGVYTVKLAILAKEDDYSSEIVATDEYYFSIIRKEACKHQETYLSCENNLITATCKNCNHIAATAEVGTNKRTLSECIKEGEKIFVCPCDGEEIAVRCSSHDEYFEDVSIVYGYYQYDGSIKYSVKVPTEYGTYTAHLAYLEDDNNPNSAIFANDDVVFEIFHHYWVYDTDGLTLTADCLACGEHAYVTLDASGAEYASRNYDADSREEHFDYEVFYQNNWAGQEGIEQFYILYNGVAVEDEFNSTLNKNVAYKPTHSGNYTARIVLLNDLADIENVYMSTDEIAYYLAGTSFGNPYLKIAEYSEEQYFLLDEPAFENEAYQIGSFEDLMWMARFGDLNTDINITNDIIFNPITVTNGGETVRCGSNIIYIWPGIGDFEKEYSGNIYGNNHTIYGLYSKGYSLAGLINYGSNSNAFDLTISDSVLCGDMYAGGIYAVDECFNLFLREYSTISNCRVLNSVITSSDHGSPAGGLIGFYYAKGGLSTITIDNCLVDSKITGGYGAGGIIGFIDSFEWFGHDYSIRVSNSINLGSVSGQVAGGIIGYSEVTPKVVVSDCANAGVVDGHYYADAILARCNLQEGSDISENLNIGKILAGGKVKKDVKSNIKLSKVCDYLGYHILANKYELVEPGDCNHDGRQTRTCLVCSRVYDAIVVHAHGHNFMNGACIYCEESESYDGVASVFSDAGTGIYVLASIIILACIVTFVFAKKRKGSHEESN